MEVKGRKRIIPGEADLDGTTVLAGKASRHGVAAIRR